MANWQVISLDTVTPQLRAPGTGDGYSFNSGSTQLGVWTTTGLGIGTASPAEKLDVNGAIAIGGTKFFSKITSDSYIWNNTSALNFVSSDGNTVQMKLDSSGNLGLGVAPSAWASGSQALQNGGGSFFQYNNDRVFIGQNTYIDTSFGDRFIGNGYATRYRQYQGAHAFYVSTVSNSSGAGASQSLTQAMTLNASGQLLVSTTTAVNDANIQIQLNSASNSGKYIGFNRENDYGLIIGYNNGTGYDYGDIRVVPEKPLVFSTNNTPRARITSGGNLLVGCTATPSASVKGFGIDFDANGPTVLIATADTGSDRAIGFYNPNGLVGDIVTNGSATAYNTSSDRRLKENIVPADDAGSVVDSIQIVKHDWKVGGHVRYGVIAQDLHAVAPEAVKVGDDNEEVSDPWGVDYSKLVPMLIKEVQSLRKRVAELESK